ncbi:3D domain-containing protein, partial [Desulfocurvibacter africanus]
EARFQSLVLAQDTGGAIKGTRFDLFCGSGEQAEFLAGHLQNEARMYVLVSKAALRSWEYRAAVSR